MQRGSGVPSSVLVFLAFLPHLPLFPVCPFLPLQLPSLSPRPPPTSSSLPYWGLLSPDLPGGLPGATALREAGRSHRAGWPLPAFQTHSARLHFDNTVVVIFRTLRTFFTNEYVFRKGFLYIDWLPSGVVLQPSSEPRRRKPCLFDPEQLPCWVVSPDL